MPSVVDYFKLRIERMIQKHGGTLVCHKNTATGESLVQIPARERVIYKD